jgi:hypothetical protein
MSGVLRTIAVVATVVALTFAIPGVGAAIGGAIGVASLGAASATIATIATAVAAAASVGAALLQKPPDMQGSINQVMIGSNMPIPCCLGRTYVGGNMVYDNSAPGPNGHANKDRTQIMVGSIGPINAFEVFQADYSTVRTATSGLISGVAGGFYGADGGYMWINSRKGLLPDTALTAPAGRSGFTGWGVNHKLSGLACWSVTMEFDEDGVRYAGGIPAFGMVLKGPAVYDPRLDSTYPGGSGSQRWTDETTWTWSENPALHALTYLRGRFQNAIKVFGCGYPKAAVDIAFFVALANICDANSWKCGGQIYEGPGISKWNNLKTILDAAAAKPAMVGGVVTGTYSAPRTALDTITKTDLTEGDVEIPAMGPWKDKFNTIVPRYRSEPHRWEYVQANAVIETAYLAEDGEGKSDERQYDLIQNVTQAAQRAAYDLTNEREYGPIKLPCKPRLKRFRPGEALNVDFGSITDDPALGVQLCVITSRTVDPATGAVQLELYSETSSKHAYALGKTGVAPPTPTIPASGDIDSAITSAAYVLNAVASDDILSTQEKRGPLAKYAADLEARYQDLLNRAATLGVSTTALTAARTNWLLLLNSYSPAWNDTKRDTVILQSALTSAQRDFPNGWQAFNGGVLSYSATIPYVTLTDSDTSQHGGARPDSYYAISPGQTLSGGVVVRKSPTHTTNWMVFNVRAANSSLTTVQYVSLAFNPYNGLATVPDLGGSPTYTTEVLDLGSDWYIRITMGGVPAGSAWGIVEVYPAVASGDAWPGGYNVATTGSVDINDCPDAVVGDSSKLGHHMLTGRLNAYVAQLTAVAKAVSSTDATLANFPDGPKTITADYNSSTGSPISLPKNYTYYLKNSGGILTSGSIAWKYVVLAGTVNGHAAGTTEYTDYITNDTGSGIFALQSLGSGSAKIEMRAYIGALMWPYQVDLIKNLTTATGGGGGGGGGGTLPVSIGATYGLSGSTFVKIAQSTGTTGASQTSASLSASFTLSDASGAKSDTCGVELKWMRSGSQKGSTGSGSCSIVNWEPNDGVISASATDTGLTASTSYTWELWARCTASTKACIMDGGGTIT